MKRILLLCGTLLSCTPAYAQPAPTPLNGTPSGPSAAPLTPYVTPGQSMVLEPAATLAAPRTYLSISVDYLLATKGVLHAVTCTADGSTATVARPGGWTLTAAGQSTGVISDPAGIAWQGPVQCATQTGAYVTVKVYPQ